MSAIIKCPGPGKYSAWMKKKPVAILSIVAVTIMLGYLFFLSWLIGLLFCKYMSGRSDGERGKVRSIVVPLRGWKVHLHHWFYAGCILVISSTTGVHVLAPIITYGFLGGFIFQGIYYYSDWHRIVIRKREIAPASVNRAEVTRKDPAEFDILVDDILQLTSNREDMRKIVTLDKSSHS